MALKGNLRDFSITQLLNLINLARKTGTLMIDSHKAETRLCFKGGKLVYATLDGQDTGLAGMLHRSGRLTEQQTRVIKDRGDIKGDKELGLMLIDAGYVGQRDIVDAVRSHMLNSVYPLFTWSEGTFRFESNLLPFEDRILIPVDLENVIMAGSRRMEEWERLQEELPELDVALKFAERPKVQLRNISLSVEEWRAVSFINPRNTIRQIAQHNNMSEFQIRKIVYGLLQAGLVEVVRSRPEESTTQGAEPGRRRTTVQRPAVKRGVVEKLIKFLRRM